MRLGGPAREGGQGTEGLKQHIPVGVLACVEEVGQPREEASGNEPITEPGSLLSTITHQDPVASCKPAQQLHEWAGAMAERGAHGW